MAKRPLPAALPAEPSEVTTLPTATSRTLIERAYGALRNDIIQGRLAPGEKLRVEHLKVRYDVGAGTLREALTRLVSDALVVTEGQRGFHVAPIAIEDLEDLTELRIHIEIHALRQSVRHGDAQWRARLRQTYERLSTKEQPLRLQHSREWENLNTQFHETLISGQASAWTLKLLRLLTQHGERYRRYSMSLPQEGRDLHQEHREIFESAMAGNELRAALALEAHIRATPNLIRSALQRGVDVFQTGA